MVGKRNSLLAVYSLW